MFVSEIKNRLLTHSSKKAAQGAFPMEQLFSRGRSPAKPPRRKQFFWGRMV